MDNSLNMESQMNLLSSWRVSNCRDLTLVRERSSQLYIKCLSWHKKHQTCSWISRWKGHGALISSLSMMCSKHAPLSSLQLRSSTLVTGQLSAHSYSKLIIKCWPLLQIDNSKYLASWTGTDQKKMATNHPKESMAWTLTCITCSKMSSRIFKNKE